MNLLKRLYGIHSPSGKEGKMRDFIRQHIRKNVPNCRIRNDEYGNIYITKGVAETYPCIVAHLDQVQKTHSKDFQVIDSGVILMGYSPSRHRMEGLGADDKNGIWIALKCLSRHDSIKVAFFVEEEIGCQGSMKADMEFFKDVRYVIQPDRRGTDDLITTIGWTDLCSKEFVKAIRPKRFGYKEEEGMMTDVLTLKENGLGVSCVNLSCGYFNPHTDYEFTEKKALLNCLRFVNHIIGNVTESYPHEDDGYGNITLDDIYIELEETIDWEITCNPSRKFEEIYSEIHELYPMASKSEVQAIYEQILAFHTASIDDDDNHNDNDDGDGYALFGNDDYDNNNENPQDINL